MDGVNISGLSSIDAVLLKTESKENIYVNTVNTMIQITLCIIIQTIQINKYIELMLQIT